MKASLRNLYLLPVLIAGLGLILAGRVTAQTNHTSIPFSQIGDAAREHYTGNGLSIVQSAEGASLRCVFQKLEGRINSEGLWLTSTTGPSNNAPFRVVAQSVGREHCRPLPLVGTGEVEALAELARFHRVGLDEEYTVSVDGVRQDFIIESPPLNPQRSTLNQSAGDLRVVLAPSGARAVAAAGGARLRLDGSGRVLAYSRLRVKDATGQELTAHLEVLSADQLAVSVADANATYPVRIDPTFSDADWVSLGSGVNNAVRGSAKRFLRR